MDRIRKARVFFKYDLQGIADSRPDDGAYCAKMFPFGRPVTKRPE